MMRFNVIGHITSEIGLGVMACDLIQALHDLGHDVVGFDVDPGLNRMNRSKQYDPFLRSAGGMYRDGIDIAVFPVSAVEHWSRAYKFGKRRVAMPLWELPDINARWVEGLRRFDGVLCCSPFIHMALSGQGLRLWDADHPHYVPATLALSAREDFGLPSDRVVFTFAFDPSSDLQRKNPTAIVEAFLAANMPNSLLCIQINKSGEAFQTLDQWLGQLPADRVRVINRHLSQADAMQLIACSDAYISLHRSEGLGLGMLEAMQLGKAVIATAWSGNLGFMDADSACLVPADLVALNGNIPAYTENVIGAQTYWADPQVAEAAEWIRRLASSAELRSAKGAAARLKSTAYQSRARQMLWTRNLLLPPARPAKPIKIGRGEKVLIFTPTWIDERTAEDAIAAECSDGIRGQALRADFDFDWWVTTDNPWPIGDHRNVLHQYQRAREYFLRSDRGWDALLTVEHDNILTEPDALLRMYDTPGDVIYAPYRLRHGQSALSAFRFPGSRHPSLKDSLTYYPAELAQARAERVWRVSGAGFGCTLIRRHVLEAIGFEEPGGRDTNWSPDLRFVEACREHEFVSMARFDVIVDHLDQDSGERLPPYTRKEVRLMERDRNTAARSTVPASRRNRERTLQG